MRTAIAMVLLTACAAEDSSVATGQLEAWTAGPALPTARANHCSAAIGEWVLAIGGNHKQGDSFVKTDEIHAARVADGVVGAWQLAGHTASPVTECSATSDGQQLFVIDGIYDRETDGRQVFSAAFDQASGMLGTLAPIATLPSAVISSEATARGGGELLVMDTLLPDEGDQTVTYRRRGDVWATADWGIGFRAQAEYAFSDRFAYTLGGYLGGEGNPATAEVFVSSIDITDVRATTPLPEPVMFGEAIAVDDWVFVVGGRSQVFGGTASTKVFAARSTNGELGAWSEVAALPVGRTNHELVLVGDELVVIGGASDAGGDANVLAARVRF